MSSQSTMFWPSSESNDGLTPDSRIWSWYFLEFKVPVTTFNCIMWSSDNAARTINVDRFVFLILPFSLCYFKGLPTTL